MHSWKAKAFIYSVLWVDAAGVEESYFLLSAMIIFPLQSPHLSALIWP